MIQTENCQCAYCGSPEVYKLEACRDCFARADAEVARQEIDRRKLEMAPEQHTEWLVAVAEGRA